MTDTPSGATTRARLSPRDKARKSLDRLNSDVAKLTAKRDQAKQAAESYEALLTAKTAERDYAALNPVLSQTGHVGISVLPQDVAPVDDGVAEEALVPDDGAVEAPSGKRSR